MGIVSACIMLNQRLTNISSASVQNQAVVNHGSPSQAAEVKVAGSASEVCAGWLRCLYVSVTTKGGKAETLARCHVMSEFRISIIEGNVGEIRSDPISHKPSDVALPS